MEGYFQWKDLLIPQNEHRIIPTKLLSLWLLKLNELWNPLLQMIANAFIHILSIVVLIALLYRAIEQRHLPLIAGTATIIFCLGIGWQNTLHGISSHWYFNCLFGLPALWFLLTSLPLGIKWWLGAILGLLAAMSAASGALLFAASAITWLIVYFQNNRDNYRHIAASTASFLIFLLCYSLIPTVEAHGSLKAHSILKFLLSLADIWMWPFPGGTLPGLLFHAPAAVFAVVLLIACPRPGDPRWFLFALAAWCTGQAISMHTGESRYRSYRAIQTPLP